MAVRAGINTCVEVGSSLWCLACANTFSFLLPSPRLFEIFRNLAQLSSLSQVGCAIINQSQPVISEEECRISFPWREREKGRKKINRVYSFVILKGKLSLVSNDTIGHCCELLHSAILAEERLRYEPNECLDVQKYDKRRGTVSRILRSG